MVAELFPGGAGAAPDRRSAPRPSPSRTATGGSRRAEAGDEETDDYGAPKDEAWGVEIEVTPAGKSTRRLSLLSGGEKSLVALAFVFAVLMARPCPFYILDEVEAALDDINIDRFLRLVRRFAERSQFIVVTHQKRTMDAADILYGVSMGGDGITKVVSRKLPRDGEHPAGRRPRGRRRRGRSRRSPSLAAAPWNGRHRRSTSATGPRFPSRTARSRARAGSSRACARGSRAAARRWRRAQRQPLRPVDEETWEALEEALILADVGAPTTAAVVRRLEDEVEAGELERRERPCASG